MSSTALPEDVIRSLSRFLFACIPPGQAVVQLFDPNHGDLYLVKGSDDGEHPFPQSPSGTMLSDLGLRSPPQALLTELADSLRFAIQDDRRHSTVGTLSTVTDMSEMSFADPGSDLRSHALFYSVQDTDTAQDTFSPLPPVSPTPHRSGSPLRLHGDSDSPSPSHPSDGDASSSSIEGTAGSDYSPRDDRDAHEELPYVTCASIAPGSFEFTSEGSPIHILADRSPCSPCFPSPTLPPSPLKLFGLSSLPTGLSPSPAGPRSPLGIGIGMGMGMGLAASRVTADFLSITGSSRSPTSAADLRAAYTSPYSPTTSTPVRDAMRRALAVMIMHRGNSPQPRRGRRGTRSTSPLSRAELVGLPAGEAAARIVAAVKAREQDRTRAWAAAQASAGAGAPVRYGDVSGETGAEGSGDEDKARL